MKKISAFLVFLFIGFLNTTLYSQCTTTPVSTQTNVSCNGGNNGSAAVTIAGPYTYSWSNGAVTSSITNLSAGNYSVAITSTTCAGTGPELVVNGDFSAGNTSFFSSYTYKTPPNTAASQYWVAPGSQNSTWNGAFLNYGDHTTGLGNFMLVNGSGIANSVVWTETIAVTPNTNYNFSAWISSLYPVAPAQLQFSINSSLIGPVFNAPATVGTWVNFFSVWNSGVNTSAVIAIVNQNLASGGNDFGLDDISFKACSTCSYTANFTITEPPPLVLNINSVSGSCTQPSATISAAVSGGTGPYNYLWAPNSQTTSAIITNTGGTYSVGIMDANGCLQAATANVTVAATPTPIVSNSGTVCVNSGVVTLNASGGDSYSWTGPGGFSSTQQNTSVTASTPASSGQYFVTVSVGSCSATVSTMVQVNPLPVPQANVNGPVCVNEVFGLSGSGGTTYLWNGPGGFFSAQQNPTLIANSVSSSGNYSLTVIDNNGCSAGTFVNATVKPLPQVSIIASDIRGCVPLCVTFTCSSDIPVQNLFWTLGNGGTGNSTTINTCYDKTGIYNIEALVTATNGCSNAATFTVEPYPNPVADFNHAPLRPIINVDQEVTFTDASYGAVITSWNWYFMNTAQHTSLSQNPTFSYEEPGTYAVALVVKSDKGCMDTLVRSLVVGEDYGIYVPNSFTPNGDGLNDIFQPKGFGITKYELNIFDRWGEKVFSTSNFSEGWSGAKQKKLDVTYQQVIEEGTYSWLINCTSVFGKAYELKGHVTLIK